MATFKSSKFRSKATAAILNKFAAEPDDFALSKWTELAIEDLREFIHLRDCENKTTQRAWWAALRNLREGVELFANTFYPNCTTFEDRRTAPKNDLRLFYDFKKVREQDVIDMATHLELTA